KYIKLTFMEDFSMKIEFKIYLTRNQKLALRRINRFILSCGYGLKNYILPFIELIAGIIMAFSMCCIDSPNFKFIFSLYCISTITLIVCHLLRLYIGEELRRARRTRLRSATI
ncbi:MAG: hypothetical protein Q4B86_07975, partial [Eubacteriales bacterium]|nr:hypothetical protein [Eubacteriales bacterium]